MRKYYVMTDYVNDSLCKEVQEVVIHFDDNCYVIYTASNKTLEPLDDVHTRLYIPQSSSLRWTLWSDGLHKKILQRTLPGQKMGR